jgi:transcription antitermination factor NusG
MNIVMKWYVVDTRPRWEKKVHNSLVDKGIECFCPINKVYRQWSDRVKMVEEPLFPSQVFVKICDNDRTSVRMTAGVRNFVYKNGKPTVIREKEIQNLKKFLDNYSNIRFFKNPIDQSNFLAELSEINESLPYAARKKISKHALCKLESLQYVLIADIRNGILSF